MADAGPVALVTGAANGIGLATADELHRRGFRVVYADLDGDAAQEAALSADHSLDTAYSATIDITDTDSVNAAMAAVADRFGGLDALVNNAGVPGRHITAEMTDDEWHWMLGVNLDGAFKCSRAAYPLLLLSAQPSIVNVSSVSSVVGMVSRIGYTTSKAGINGMTRALSTEWGSQGIRVNAVAPGYVRTSGFDRRMSTGDPGIVAELERDIPLGRLCRPEEIASAICFLASADASYVTGHCLVVDGGLTTSARG
ncbi:3-oxoacyl-[acyl-carrier-protein] reductase [soil metagenome]